MVDSNLSPHEVFVDDSDNFVGASWNFVPETTSSVLRLLDRKSVVPVPVGPMSTPTR